MLDTPTKALWSGAVVAVILAAGVYLAKEFREYSDRSTRQARIEAVRAELFNIAGAAEGDVEKVKTTCLGAENMAKNGGEHEEFVKKVARNCRALGYL